tara:strand:+ start:151 stop:276 length:126 start_codon:yes stop_codon:yes gene_type:complete
MVLMVMLDFLVVEEEVEVMEEVEVAVVLLDFLKDQSLSVMQ